MERSTTALGGDVTPRRRVIVLAYHYHPDPAVGSLRARNVAQAFSAAGHDVHVVTTALEGQPQDSHDGAVHVVRVESGASPRTILTTLSGLVGRRHRSSHGSSAAQSVADASAAGWKRPERVSTLKRWLGAVTWLPDDRQGFIMPAARAAALLMRGDGLDLLYSTAPPISDQLVGLVLRIKRRRFRWIMEFRDPWTDNSYKPWFVRSKATDALSLWLEGRSMMTCDGVVTVTKAYADVLRERYGDAVMKKLVVVRNGIPAVLPPTPSDPNVFRIVYAGTFYLRRDPKPFLAAIAAVHRRRGPHDPRLDVRLVGDCRFFDGEALEPEVERLGIADVVSFVDWLPHAESVELMRSADILLLLAQDQPLAVPNKLYEYLGMGKPIIAFADDVGETAILLREVGGQYVITERDGQPEIEMAITDAMKRSARIDATTPVFASLATDAQMKTLIAWTETSRAATR